MCCATGHSCFGWPQKSTRRKDQDQGSKIGGDALVPLNSSFPYWSLVVYEYTCVSIVTQQP